MSAATLSPWRAQLLADGFAALLADSRCPDCGERIERQRVTGYWEHAGLSGDCWRLADDPWHFGDGEDDSPLGDGGLPLAFRDYDALGYHVGVAMALPRLVDASGVPVPRVGEAVECAIDGEVGLVVASHAGEYGVTVSWQVSGVSQHGVGELRGR